MSPAILHSRVNLQSPWSCRRLAKTLNVKGMLVFSPVGPPLIFRSISHCFIFRNHGEKYVLALWLKNP